MSKPIEIIARGVLMNSEAICLCRNIGKGYRYLPGGHVEIGESAEDALKREFMEEAGLKVRVGPLLLTHEHRFRQKGRDRHEYNLVFHVEQVGRKPIRSIEPDIAFDWIHWQDLGEAALRPASMVPWLRRMRRGNPASWISG